MSKIIFDRTSLNCGRTPCGSGSRSPFSRWLRSTPCSPPRKARSRLNRPLRPMASPCSATTSTAGALRSSKPSSIALCSDRDLRALAVKRQGAFDEAKARLDPDQQKALLADQNAWVVSYSHACGIAPDAPPSLPLAPSIQNCMAKAGARADRLSSHLWPVGKPIRHGDRRISACGHVGAPKLPIRGDGLDDFCKTATSPRSIALCSDRDLRALAVERQQAMNEARLGH